MVPDLCPGMGYSDEFVVPLSCFCFQELVLMICKSNSINKKKRKKIQV